ncbi:MAG: FAD-dependent hydroxylase [Pegethrix bostrychoides GSE-TBD4-15B]|jgi:2-octaprenyl-6-methoxyphenol hydroxylase|uniref:FAD-dependent hydroxylase n=1 Tax=Pegethrix bostrychoides GSE-TBD4-15B TaxID=2839662 RepID=A0A951P936_9CYAN|nr:FAD-dependent hydroxylase [Pegethrix bostrychoides GSE-TBD4-15B]
MTAVASVPNSAAAQPRLDYDLTIAGSGIVGLTLACLLKDSGLRIALIDAQPRQTGLQQRRAYALTLMTGRIFAGLGIWSQILPQITTFTEIRLSDAESPAVVRLSPQDLGRAGQDPAGLGYVGEHCVLVQALLDALAAAKTITWLSPAEVTQVDYQPDAAVLSLLTLGETRQIRTGLLVAADGSRSAIRQWAGIRTAGWQYWQSCVTAVIRPAQPHANIAREHFWPSGPFATLPLPDNRCQIVLTAPHAEAQHWTEAAPAEFLAELQRRYQGELGELELLSQQVLFPVKLMQSQQYSRPRLVLVGDAAHCCHPVGGQGLNLGIRDAAALAQVLQTAQQQGEDLGDLRVLQRYERWRRLENWAILGFTDLLDRCFSSRFWPLVATRRLGLRAMRRLPLLRYLALQLMTGLLGRQPAISQQPGNLSGSSNLSKDDP